MCNDVCAGFQPSLSNAVRVTAPLVPWLVKSEPDVYSIEDLERDGQTMWDSIRNYQARNTMRDLMKIGDRVLFYHSNAKPPGVAGVAKVCSAPYPDPTQFDDQHKYYDPKSDPENPRWMLVDVAFVARFDHVLPLHALRDEPALQGMPLLQKGQRLSVQPVSDEQYAHILEMARVTSDD